jgi:hypothetical protein
VALRQLDTNLNAGHSTDFCAKYNETKFAWWRAGVLPPAREARWGSGSLAARLFALRAQADRMSALRFSKETSAVACLVSLRYDSSIDLEDGRVTAKTSLVA